MRSHLSRSVSRVRRRGRRRWVSSRPGTRTCGGRTAAILASLTSTCRRHDVDPQLYLTQLFMNLPAWPARDLDDWLPDQWKLRYPASLATFNPQD